MTKQDDLINDLATMARKLYVERVACAGILLGLKSNGLEARTEELTKPYADALYVTLDNCYKICRQLGRKVGKTPKRGFSATVKCDARCQNARGYECVCSCGGTGHGMGNLRA